MDPPSFRPFALAALALGIAACSAAPSDAGASSASAAERAPDAEDAYCTVPGRFQASGGVVVDEASDAGAVEWEQAIAPSTLPQPDAAGYCASLSLDGGGWRLPTVPELDSLLVHPLGLGAHPASACVPGLDQTAFPGTPADDFWTGQVSAEHDAWYTSFHDGRSHRDGLDVLKYVRCVRTGDGAI